MASQADTSTSEPYVVELDDSYYEPDEEEDTSDPQTTDSPGYKVDGTNSFTFQALNDLVKRTTKSGNAKASTRAKHDANQRQVWSRIETEAADESIPTALFDPPRTFVQVSFVSWPREGHYCCPCDSTDDDVRAKLEIRAESGITKDVFVKQVADALYVEGRVGGEDDRPVVKSFDYMMSSGHDGAVLMGDIYACTEGLSGNK